MRSNLTPEEEAAELEWAREWVPATDVPALVNPFARFAESVPQDAPPIRWPLRLPGSHEPPDLDELLAIEEPEHDFIVPGLLERGDRVVLTGGEGRGKSTLKRQIAVMVASGIHPFTLDAIPPIRVLLADFENGRRHVKRKLRPLREEAGDRYQPGNLRVHVAPGGIDLLRKPEQDEFDAMVRDTAPDAIFAGPLYKMAGGDPTREDDARKLAGFLDGLRDRYGCALFLEAHSPYASNGRKREVRPYGASLWSRWPEFGIHLDVTGKLEHWRGPRDERDWPACLRKSTPWPWMPAPDLPASSDATWKPTVLMARASARLYELDGRGDHPSKDALAKATTGKREYKLKAIETLIDEGYADLDPSGKRLIHVKLYTEDGSS